MPRAALGGRSFCPTCTPSAPDGDGNVRTVIKDEERIVAVGRGPEGRTPPQEIARLRVLLTELHDVDAGGQHRVEKGVEVALRLAGVCDEVQPGAGKPLAPRVTQPRHHPGPAR